MNETQEKPVETGAMLTPHDLARRCNVALKTVQNWTQARRVPGAVKMGSRSWRYDRRSVERALMSGNFLLPKLR